MALPWTLHGDGGAPAPGSYVGPLERLSWGRTAGVGAQHVIAMFGATFLVPAITGFPPSTTLLFSGLGTLLFLLITRNRVPSYLGSSFAFIAPISAATAAPGGGMGAALGGVILSGALLAAVGLLVQFVGAGWISRIMPPLVTGAIVALIGLNLAPAAKANVDKSPVTALVTIAAVLLSIVLFKGLLGRLSILMGVAAGYVTALIRGEVNFEAIEQAAWFGLPQFHRPEFVPSLMAAFVPVVFVLIAENVGHVKSVSAMTGENLDPYAGRALMADGLATMLAGSAGGSGTTTYAENIGVMAASKVYSTAAYWMAGLAAVVLSLLPKFGAAIATVPPGVLGGAGTVLYGMIGLLGVRIWVSNRVSFAHPINLMVAAVALVVGIGDYTWTIGSVSFGGIALGTAAALIGYHGLTALARLRGSDTMSETEDHPVEHSELG
ncbi:solute carrier family 23 protein [Falsarthrobacter nasiphocae]|uniref:NCS2 family nucleobase:cation symporter-2 n=2 Tax=Falsarthrobacter nasiphocae TaxID=189863 RepID=A0AAE3YFW6_9MICC|nr:solute carrier family 23 protein [Falsarthrobacter nasiphocae]MDR6892007.1 NCS2 family nucleobase:cation symporter-2 [Falsarthrobacter nasiphocae]